MFVGQKVRFCCQKRPIMATWMVGTNKSTISLQPAGRRVSIYLQRVNCSIWALKIVDQTRIGVFISTIFAGQTQVSVDWHPNFGWWDPPCSQVSISSWWIHHFCWLYNFPKFSLLNFLILVLPDFCWSPSELNPILVNQLLRVSLQIRHPHLTHDNHHLKGVQYSLLSFVG